MDVFKHFAFTIITKSIFSFTHVIAGAVLVILILYLIRRENPVYLVDFACYLPADSLRLPSANFVEHMELARAFNRESIDFQKKVLERSGVGDEACAPIAMHELPPPTTHAYKPAKEEIEEVLFAVVQEILSKNRVNPESVDILVSNCSLFCPTPSITAMIINKFGFRSSIKSVSLSGMGCSAGLLSISLVKDLFKVRKNSLALVLSMEAVTPNGYRGTLKSMLVANTIFRLGGAAILLSNKRQDKQIAHYELRHLVRTHMGAEDKFYSSIFQQADKESFEGVSLSRELLNAAGNALTINLSELGSHFLPYSEQLRYVWTIFSRKVFKTTAEKETYVPRFKKAFEHFCIHPGGRAIIDAVQNNLKLENGDGEASRMTLYRFGNTSSSSVWYELCYLEAKGKIRKGDRIWQIAFGSGFKCNSAVWVSIAHPDQNERNAWSDRIHLYPVQTTNVERL